jgi:hypothetical protein
MPILKVSSVILLRKAYSIQSGTSICVTAMNRQLFAYCVPSVLHWYLTDIFLASSDRIGCSWTELAIQCQQLLARQPQVRHRKQRGEPRGVLPRAMIAHLHVAELPLDHAKRVCDPPRVRIVVASIDQPRGRR